jgi:hypothetical protein
MFEPNQLVLLTECVKSVHDVPGCIVAGGVRLWSDNRFLEQVLESREDRARYYAVDAFSGFVDEHTKLRNAASL